MQMCKNSVLESILPPTYACIESTNTQYSHCVMLTPIIRVVQRILGVEQCPSMQGRPCEANGQHPCADISYK